MDKFKKSYGMVVSTSMSVKEKHINSSNFLMKDIIDHLIRHERYITVDNPIRKELYDLCISTLRINEYDRVIDAGVAISTHPRTPARTFFYPSCRIIRIDLTETPRSHRTSVRAITTQEHECGFLMSKGKGAHSTLVIKIERMTDVSCFASWTVIR